MTFEEILPKIPKTGVADEGVEFICHALDFVCRHNAQSVTASAFAEHFAIIAKAEFGGLARIVLAQWGINTTRDLGRVVFALIEAGVFLKTHGDNLSDFDNLYDFAVKFDMDTVVREICTMS
jgi:uncharacterized repeat protein (TIGR04138 family)